MDLNLLMLIPLSFAMGFVNSISGGGGVFGVPALMAMGFPPVNALALNRISDLGYILGSIRNYTKLSDFQWKLALGLMPLLLIGAAIGANIVVALPPEKLSMIIVGAVFISMFFLIYPMKPKPEGTKPYYVAGVIAVLLLGVWDGAFAMAGGTFGVLILIMLFHRSYLGAKSISIAAGVPETILSMSILWFHSTVDLKTAAAMFLSGGIGAFAGSKLAIKGGNNFIRYAMAGMAFVMVIKVVVFDILKFSL